MKIERRVRYTVDVTIIADSEDKFWAINHSIKCLLSWFTLQTDVMQKIRAEIAPQIDSTDCIIEAILKESIEA